jgi:PAS domain S-box-containing protein/putative nucleotidyltransferase with HDIG domain
MRKKDGREMDCLLTTTLLPGEDGSILGYQGVIRDITERKRAEEALRESEEKFRSLAERSPNMIFINKKGKVLYANQKCEEIMGYTREQFYSGDFDFFSLIAPESVDLVAGSFDKHLKGEDVPAYEYTLVTEQGKLIEAILATSLISYGGESAILGIVTDITERKRSEEELQRSYDRLQTTLEGTVNALAALAEARDPYTAGHQQRVAHLGCAIAEEMALSGEKILGLRMAGLVHDIGKIYVPAEILSKPADLTAIEMQMIKTHPQTAHNILKEVEFPWAVALIVLQHHERMDGSGYPQGLAGDEMLLEAKILGVADVVEAMASNRPYRPAHGIEEALDEIGQHRDTLYEADVVDACLKLFRERGF